ncbi:MAG TPA: serine hydrolase [Gammaproteobacteria bacterium]
MTLIRTLFILVLLASSGARSDDAASQQILAFADRLSSHPLAPPGYAIAIVARDGTVLVHSGGIADASTHRKITSDSIFYIASVTKSYVGLLAARLHAEGRFDLDAPMTAIWPKLELPQGLDASKVTFRMLLSHVTPFDNDVIGWRGSFAGEMSPEEIELALREWTEPQEGFEYTNNGYIITAAALQLALGKSWKTLLREEILQPLGMHDTAARTSLFAPDRFAVPHALVADGWLPTAYKSDEVCHAAGGLHATIGDVATWMQVMLGHRKNDEVSIEVIKAALTQQAVQDREYHGFDRNGYALGWNISRYGGRTIYEHGGGWHGVRAFVSFMPDAGIGVAVVSNGGKTGNIFNLGVLQHAYDVLFDDAGSIETRQRYESTITKLEQARPEAEKAGPTVRGLELDSYVGTYANEALGELVIRRDGNELVGAIGAYRLRLIPQTHEDFMAVEYPESDPDSATFSDFENGIPQAMDWEGIVFHR